MLTFEIIAKSIAGLFILLSIFLVFGWFSFKVKKNFSFHNSYERLFWFLLVGMLIVVSVYAILRTGGRTILLPIPFLSYFLIHKYKFDEKLIYPKSKPITVFLFTLSIIILSYLWYLKTFISFDKNIINYVSGDNLFYSRVADYLNKIGKENNSLEYIYTERFSVIPYHYGDLWLCAFISWLINIKSIYALILVMFPLLILIFILGLTGIVYRYLGKVKMNLKVLVICLFSFLFSGFSSLFPHFLLTADIISTPLAYLPKLLWVSCLLIGTFYCIKNNDIFILFVLICIAGLSFINVFPSLLIAAFLWIFLLAIRKQIDRKKILIVIGLLILIFTFLFTFYLPQTKGNENGSFNSPFDISYFKTALNILIGGSFQFFVLLPIFIMFLIAAFWAYKKAFFKKFISELLLQWIVVLGFSALLAWSILFIFSSESVQFFSNIFIPISAIIIALFLCWVFEKINNLSIKIIAACIFILMVITNIRNNTNSQFDAKELSSLNKFLIKKENIKFASLKDSSEFRTIFQKNTRVYQHLPILNYILDLYINESLNAPFLKVDSDMFYKSYVSNAIKNTSFNYFINNDKEIASSAKADELMNAFVVKKGINYVIISSSIITPSFIKLLAKDSLILQESGVKIYRLK